jgi:predicted Holliday junction resolvase-like endonuclease
MQNILTYMQENLTIFTLTTALILIIIFILGIIFGKAFQKIKDKNELSKQREDAVKRSRAVLGGQFAEQLAPYFPDFPCNPGDVKFLGKPIDFIAFPGMAEGKKIEEIILIEVKSGESQLSEREKEIKEAVLKGKIRYVQYRIDL